MNHPSPPVAAIERALPEQFSVALAAMFGERFTTRQAVREHHGRDESFYDPTPPDAVFYALSTDEVSAAVTLCGTHGVPVMSARHHAYFALLQLRPGCRAISTDCCVPISRLAECILDTKADCEKNAMIHAIIGHVGDGNFHVLMMIDPSDPADVAKAEGVNARLVARALKMDGTCTGEHGVGMHKMEFLKQEHGEGALALMRALKHAFDPGNLLNPGKIVSWDA